MPTRPAPALLVFSLPIRAFLVLACFSALLFLPHRCVHAQASINLLGFDASSLPLNGRGEGYPNQYTGEGDVATITQDSSDAVSGKSIKFTATQGSMYAQFNLRDTDGTRHFTRDFISTPSTWRFNTYNRLIFWIKSPTNGPQLVTTGQENFHFGTYVREVTNGDPLSDEMRNGNSHYYHHLNIPPTGTWTKVIINMHPDHLRDVSGDPGNQPHPTGEQQYNYFDTLTRFYVDQGKFPPKSLPVSFNMDEFEFYQEPNQENDEQIYSICATYVAPPENRLVLTWNRYFGDNSVKHEVRYAFQNIHALGWDGATPTPGGVIAPLGYEGYNGMAYDSKSLPLSGQRKVFLAIKPQNSILFSQIELPLGQEGGDSVAPAAPANLEVAS